MGDDTSPITERTKVLNDLLAKRQSTEAARTRWLQQNAKDGIKTGSLIQAWASREAALADGTKDTPHEVLHWVSENGFQVYINQLRERDLADENSPESALPSDETLAQYKSLSSELVRRYRLDASLRAFQRYVALEQAGRNVSADLQPGVTDVVTDDGTAYTFEVLEKTDPRGFSIGFDTGCCMTIDGASESCIWADMRIRRMALLQSIRTVSSEHSQ